jgi:hypothetical protein
LSILDTSKYFEGPITRSRRKIIEQTSSSMVQASISLFPSVLDHQEEMGDHEERNDEPRNEER